MNTIGKQEILLAKITASHSTHHANCLNADLACFKIRIGLYSDAREIIAHLKEANLPNPSYELSVRLHLAEGLFEYYGNFGGSSTDSVQRAYALSAAYRDVDLQSICAAWLAQWSYSVLDIPDMTSKLLESLDLARPDNFQALSRSCLVAAQAFHLAGDAHEAQSWYSLARRYALQDSDEATSSAVMHNMAWLRMLSLRTAVLRDRCEVPDDDLSIATVESMEQFDYLHDDQSWASLKPILKAQALSLTGQFDSALESYKTIFEHGVDPKRIEPNVYADIAHCNARIGKLAAAESNIFKAISLLTASTQIDDLAATYSMASKTYKLVGDFSLSEYYDDLAASAWVKFTSLQISIRDHLKPIAKENKARIIPGPI